MASGCATREATFLLPVPLVVFFVTSIPVAVWLSILNQKDGALLLLQSAQKVHPEPKQVGLTPLIYSDTPSLDHAHTPTLISPAAEPALEPPPSVLNHACME